MLRRVHGAGLSVRAGSVVRAGLSVRAGLVLDAGPPVNAGPVTSMRADAPHTVAPSWPL